MSTDAVILAGGQSLRMGGQDKGLMPLGERALISWVIAALAKQSAPVADMLISANRNQHVYERLGLKVVRDIFDGFPGPMAGIHAAMTTSPADYLLVVPCDVPALPADLLAKMQAALQTQNAVAAFARSASGDMQPTICLLHRSVRATITERLAQRQGKLRDWLASLGAVAVDFPGCTFANLNTPSELAEHAGGATPDMSEAANPALTHFNAAGQAHMVDVGAKAETHRVARTEGYIRMLPATLALVAQGGHKKGDVLGIARIAAIMAAKKASELIPLCHPLPLTRVDVDFSIEADGVRCEVIAETVGKTGVEMEALTAVNVALLTIYDMCKAVDRGMVIDDVRLLEKRGGKSGDWHAGTS